MYQGYIKLYRKIKDSSLWKGLNSKQRDILINLLMMANHKENKWIFNGIEYNLKPGQMITSLESIKKECAKDVSTQNIRTCLLKLEKNGFLTNESTNQNRLITIINWELYQGHERNQQTETQSANKKVTTNNNVNNDKKNIYKLQCDELWNIYPNKKGKSQAYKKIYEIINKYSVEEIKRCVERYSKEVEGKDKKYILHGSTFFNDRYEDYLDKNYKLQFNNIEQKESEQDAIPFVIGGELFE